MGDFRCGVAVTTEPATRADYFLEIIVLPAFLLGTLLICFLTVVVRCDFETWLAGAAIAMLPPRRATLRIIGINLFMIITSSVVAVVVLILDLVRVLAVGFEVIVWCFKFGFSDLLSSTTM